MIDDEGEEERQGMVAALWPLHMWIQKNMKKLMEPEVAGIFRVQELHSKQITSLLTKLQNTRDKMEQMEKEQEKLEDRIKKLEERK